MLRARATDLQCTRLDESCSGGGGTACCPLAADPHLSLGKYGALGHGDTNKKAVGRPVKALQGMQVHAAACGADWLLIVAAWKPPAGRAGRGGGAGGGRRATVQTAAPAGEQGASQMPGEQVGLLRSVCSAFSQPRLAQPGTPAPHAHG